MEVKTIPVKTRGITFRLREDVAPGVGTVIPGKYVKRYYGSSDARMIEDSIEAMMDVNRTPEELVKFDITIFGKINPALLTLITLDLETWDDVYGLVFINPGDDPVRLLPRNN